MQAGLTRHNEVQTTATPGRPVMQARQGRRAGARRVIAAAGGWRGERDPSGGRGARLARRTQVRFALVCSRCAPWPECACVSACVRHLCAPGCPPAARKAVLAVIFILCCLTTHLAGQPPPLSITAGAPLPPPSPAPRSRPMLVCLSVCLVRE